LLPLPSSFSKCVRLAGRGITRYIYPCEAVIKFQDDLATRRQRHLWGEAQNPRINRIRLCSNKFNR